MMSKKKRKKERKRKKKHLYKWGEKEEEEEYPLYILALVIFNIRCIFYGYSANTLCYIPHIGNKLKIHLGYSFIQILKAEL